MRSLGGARERHGRFKPMFIALAATASVIFAPFLSILPEASIAGAVVLTPNTINSQQEPRFLQQEYCNTEDANSGVLTLSDWLNSGDSSLELVTEKLNLILGNGGALENTIQTNLSDSITAQIDLGILGKFEVKNHYQSISVNVNPLKNMIYEALAKESSDGSNEFTPGTLEDILDNEINRIDVVIIFEIEENHASIVNARGTIKLESKLGALLDPDKYGVPTLNTSDVTVDVFNGHLKLPVVNVHTQIVDDVIEGLYSFADVLEKSFSPIVENCIDAEEATHFEVNHPEVEHPEADQAEANQTEADQTEVDNLEKNQENAEIVAPLDHSLVAITSPAEGYELQLFEGQEAIGMTIIGEGEPGAEILVRSNHEEYRLNVEADGRWTLDTRPFAPGGYTIQAIQTFAGLESIAEVFFETLAPEEFSFDNRGLTDFEVEEKQIQNDYLDLDWEIDTTNFAVEQLTVIDEGADYLDEDTDYLYEDSDFIDEDSELVDEDSEFVDGDSEFFEENFDTGESVEFILEDSVLEPDFDLNNELGSEDEEVDSQKQKEVSDRKKLLNRELIILSGRAPI